MSGKMIGNKLDEELPWLPVLREWLAESKNNEGSMKYVPKES